MSNDKVFSTILITREARAEKIISYLRQRSVIGGYDADSRKVWAYVTKDGAEATRHALSEAISETWMR